jgi:glucuronate isomerase
MTAPELTARLFEAIRQIPIIDTHSHIDARRPAAASLDDLLGYHYYTELAHSCGLDHARLAADVAPPDRCRAILGHFEHFANTVQADWLLHILRAFFEFGGERLTAADAETVLEAVDRVTRRPDWPRQVAAKTNLECVFLTNAFDDDLAGFDRRVYVPCLRTDDLVFQLNDPAVRERLGRATGVRPGNLRGVRTAMHKLFERFTAAGARACAVSLPPAFCLPQGIASPHDADAELNRALKTPGETPPHLAARVLWMLAETCREFGLPFDLMVGVNRRVYRGGVHQGQDLFDSRTSLTSIAELFNAFPGVHFPVSVLSHAQSQELAAFGWLFPNVFPHGHWWYSNVPAFIGPDLRARLTCVPQFKLLGYYSDAYKLEFVLPKFDMYRRELAKALAEEFVVPGRVSEAEAVRTAERLLRDNPRRVFRLENR